MVNFDTLKTSGVKSFPNRQLLDWYSQSARDLPWRESRDPYRIWLSEIILQQTRVNQGLPYYERFVNAYPQVADLANAPEDEVMKLWEGLGYYSRARNLHFTAKYISENLNGVFPNSRKELLALKGVGPYTAAAIGSIAFDLPVAAVDGNVYRVLARYFGINQSIDETTTKNQMSELAQKVLAKTSPGDHNQAMMELGATICTPKQSNCQSCPLQTSCVAFRTDSQQNLPVRTKKTKVRERFLNYYVLLNENNIAVRRREAKDIWQGLYEFLLIESDQRLDDDKLVEQAPIDAQDEVISVSSEFKHILSHQRIYSRFVFIRIANRKLEGNYQWVPINELATFAFPRLINRFLEKSDLVIDKEVSNI